MSTNTLSHRLIPDGEPRTPPDRLAMQPHFGGGCVLVNMHMGRLVWLVAMK